MSSQCLVQWQLQLLLEGWDCGQKYHSSWLDPEMFVTFRAQGRMEYKYWKWFHFSKLSIICGQFTWLQTVCHRCIDRLLLLSREAAILILSKALKGNKKAELKICGKAEILATFPVAGWACTTMQSGSIEAYGSMHIYQHNKHWKSQV